ncbi:MAG: LytR C-terminal domain-containing protein [Candidatus Marinimicrobia bacterium]|nr:LytR C-terminal domain-containing protein [Candidatus Neomarinimicrobiota bacterium]
MDKKNRQENSGNDIQKWLFNIVIFCIAIVIIGFMVSTSDRIMNNDEKIELNRSDMVKHEYETVMIEVLNGCGVPGLANKYSNYLRQKGIDVVYVGNAESMDYDSTRVIRRVDDEKKYKLFLDVLQVSEDRIKNSKTDAPYTDFSLILGKDYPTLNINEKIMKTGE